MKPRIMMVDDSDVALEWMRTNLHPCGVEVLTSNTPFGTHALVLQNRPDLVLLDVAMPGLSGDMLCSMLKKNPKTRDTTVVLYSQLPEDELRQLARDSGADGYIKKTEDLEKLIEQLKAFVGADLHPPAGTTKAPIKVMVVDDSPFVLQWVEQNLSVYGYQVVTCDWSPDAIPTIEAERPALIILDVRMPRKSGDQVCRALKEDTKYRDIPVVLYSELPEEQLKDLAEDSLADGYISKSDDIQALVGAIEGLIGNKA